jgi:Skp family chaperone for outer membrane proteins
MDVTALALAIVGALAGPAASIKVAAISAGRTIEDITKRLSKLEERIAAIETTEPELVARLRDDVEALGKDVSTIRGDVARLAAAHDKLVAEDERRREKAAERAELRAVREHEKETSLVAKVERVHVLLETLREEFRNARTR